ncbi:7411_t:CDS:2 [Funneliformis caledonium]|uniref:7411_t:CDS:1 n=1 Tax=Funneliformis caledonium TaxID=1117310 RepID=A0A9N9FJ79_9GLOM|nr:7411_t:CDS:2 [Funneliformis caledonium]
MSGSSTTTLTVLSLNCWGLRFISKKVDQRMEAIADNLAHSDYEIVCLQEVWVYRNFEAIKQKTKKRFPYSRFYSSGVFGTGLVILSRYPIVEISFHRYRLNGRPIKFTHGDWYVGKGVASAVVDHPVAGLIEVFNTHTHAGYGSKKDDIYLAHRVSQGWEMSSLLKASASRGRNVIAIGDFNSHPESLVHKLITTHGQMTDAWQSQVPSSPSSVSSTSIHQQTSVPFDPQNSIIQKGYTSNSPLNTWSKITIKQAERDLYAGQRIDFIFYRKTSRFWCSGSRVVFTDKIPELAVSYSDHFGVEATFTLVGRDKNAVIPLSVWEQGQYEHLHELDTRTLKTVEDMFKKDLSRSQTSSRIQLFFFYLSLIVIIGLVAFGVLLASSVTFSQFWINIIIVMIIGPIASLGTVMGLHGFLFGNEEQSTLQQFIEEVQSYAEGKKVLESRASSIGLLDENESSQRSSAAADATHQIEIGFKS